MFITTCRRKHPTLRGIHLQPKINLQKYRRRQKEAPDNCREVCEDLTTVGLCSLRHSAEMAESEIAFVANRVVSPTAKKLKVRQSYE